MKRIRRLIEPEAPRPAAGTRLAAISCLLAPIAVGLSALAGADVAAGESHGAEYRRRASARPRDEG